MQRSDVMEENMINSSKSFFGDAIKDFVVKTSTDVPSVMVSMEATVYNYFVIYLSYERSNLGASIVGGNGVLLHLVFCPFEEDQDDFSDFLTSLDKELRLRIPDKYLAAKGWM